jgi:hypothetical protein
MIRILSLALALAVALPAFGTPALADTPPKKKPAVTRHVKRWTTPPGVRSPEQIEREQYGAWRRDRSIAWRHGRPRAYYFYYSSPYYYSGRFAEHRFGSRIGPCWTQTPIGPVWNCGK